MEKSNNDVFAQLDDGVYEQIKDLNHRRLTKEQKSLFNRLMGILKNGNWNYYKVKLLSFLHSINLLFF